MFSINSEQMDYLESLISFDWPLMQGIELKQSQLDQIAANPHASYYYAKEIVRGKWEQGEKAISKNPRTAFYYSLVCLGAPFDLGRFTIEQSQYKYRYIRLLNRWSNSD